MKKQTDHHYEGHLTLREFCIRAGEEWGVRLPSWSVVKIEKGSGYCLQPQLNQVLETGTVLLNTGGVKTSIRASQLGKLSLYAFSITPARLTGLITMPEQTALELASRKESVIKIFPPDSAAAQKMGDLCACQKKDGLPFRLRLLQLFVEIVGPELDRIELKEENSDAKRRLQIFLNEIPSSELLEIDFNELARQTRCTARHLGRIFYQLVGMSFRDKRAAMRLERARELLATTDSKIVDVALESGFKSLSLFNLLFARHFGISPGKWRQKQEGNGKNVENKRVKVLLSGNRQLFSGQIKAPEPAIQHDASVTGKPVWKPTGLMGMTKVASRFALVP